MKYIHFTVGLLFIAITLLPLVRKDHWIVRGFDFPHVQITIVNLALLAIFFIFFELDSTIDIVFVTLLTGCIVYQGVIIFPYTPLAGVKVKKSRHPDNDSRLSLMVTNVLMDNKNVDKCLKIIEETDPDLLLMVETNKWWQARVEETVKKKFDFWIEYPLENTYGMLLYSKYELKDSDIKFLVKKDIPSIHTTVVLKSGKEIHLHCIHPEPPAPTQSETSTERDAELLIVGKEIVDPDVPTIVAGDLNDVAWSYTTRLFIKISGLLDPRMGRGFFSTFHAEYPMMRWPLDHVFISNHFKLSHLKRLPYYGSDHFPIFLEVNYEPDAIQQQEQPSADEEEKELAEEKIEKVDQKE